MNKLELIAIIATLITIGFILLNTPPTPVNEMHGGHIDFIAHQI